MELSEDLGSGNIGKEEKEKILRIKKQAERIVVLSENFLKLIDYCDSNGIKASDRQDLDNLPEPGRGRANNQLTEVEMKLERAFEDVLLYMSEKQLSEIDKKIKF